MSRDSILLIATCTAAGATTVYTLMNGWIVRLMYHQLQIMMRPQVAVYSFLPPGRRMLNLIIENTGKSTASNLKLEIDKDFFLGEESDSSLARQMAFRKSIPSFPPGARLFYELAPAWKSFEENDTRQPAIFTVKASYTFGRKKYEESTPVDLGLYAGSSYPPSPEIDELGELRKVLTQILGGIRELRPPREPRQPKRVTFE
jgi:hypothetical protein